MSGQRLTDGQIAAALRVHLPERAAPGLQARVMDRIESTAQQRPAPTILAPLFDADPIARRRTLLIAAALLLALAFASVAATGAWRLFGPSPISELSLEPPADPGAYVQSVYQRLPELAPVAITTLEDGTTKGMTYVDRSGSVRFERYPSVDATEPETYEILTGSRKAELTIVGSDKVWIDSPDAVGEDPRVFLLASTTPILARGAGCTGTPETPGDDTSATGWRYVGVEYVIGRPTHHVACADADLWIDITMPLILRTRGPLVDDAGDVVPGAYRTIEVTELQFGDPPSDLFEIRQPPGVAQMSDQERGCILDPLCGASPVPLFTPPPGTSPAPVPSTAPDAGDNGWIAYVVQPTIGGDGPSDIYLVRQGVAPKLIAGGDYRHGHNSCPAFSPDGTRLAYATATDGPGYAWDDPAIVVIELDKSGSPVGGETRIPVADGLPCPKWSADGRDVAYLVNDALTVTRVGGETKVIPPPSEMSPWRDFAWSPVDDVIAAIRPTGIWLVPMDGSEPTLLREAAGELDYLSWSPDGSRLAVTTEILEPGSGKPGPIRIIRVDGTEPDREFGASLERASWSPTGDRIAYIDAESGLVIVDPDGGDPYAVPAIEDPEGRGTWSFGYAFTWSPDGRRMLSIAKREDWAVMSIATTGEPSPVLLTEESMDLYAARVDDVSWQPAPP